MSVQNPKSSKEHTDIKSSTINSNRNLDSVQNLDSSYSKESSTSSVKLKKSSNFLSSLVRKARRKKPKQSSDEIKHLHVSSQNLSCASTLSLVAHHEQEVEISIQNYDKKLDETLEEDLDSSGQKSSHSLDSKKLKPKSSKSKSASMSEMKHVKSENNQCEIFCDNLENETKEIEEQGIISSFVNFGKATLNIPLADGLQIVQDIVNNLRDTETQIFGLLSKYIKEPGLQKEILNLASKFNKLQWEAERRSSALANDMWLYQIETGRAQEKILQSTLNSLVKQNRELQMENENLLRNQERIMKKINVCPEHGYKTHEFGTTQVDSFVRHNEKLQGKLGLAFKKIESLEGELNLFKKQNESLEQHLRMSTSKIQNLKACLHRAKAEFDLEQTSLHFRIENQEQVLKESVEAGDVVLEDLDSLKRQFKNMPFALNWSKLKIRGSCLTDLIHLCRSCINELSKELITITNQSILKEKDMEILRETNRKLQENLEKSTSALKQFERNPFSDDSENLTPEQKCQILESEIKAYCEKTEHLKKEFECEKSCLTQTVEEYKKYKEQVEEKDKMIDQTKLFMLNMTTENYTLKNRIQELKNILKESGAGDVLDEFQQNLEELENVKLLYNQLVKENHSLHEEVKTFNTRIKELEHRHTDDRQNHQVLNKEIENLTDGLKFFKQQHEHEHHTITTLQNERMKYLDEKNLLKSIIQHLKNELSRTRQLETSLTNVSKEASKLGMIAEYNKQQGEKLKSEVTEKNQIIAELKSSVQKLNEVQIHNAKEKLSLCYELSEAYQLKEKISEILDSEVKKNQQLDQSNHDVVKTAGLHIQKFQEQQSRERSALQTALKHLKMFEEEKKTFDQIHAKHRSQIENLQQQINEQSTKLTETNQAIESKNRELENLKQRLEKNIFVENILKEKLKKEVSKYDSARQEADKIITELTKEIKGAGKVCKELKNRTEKTIKENHILREEIQRLQDTEIMALKSKIKTLEKENADKTLEMGTIVLQKEKLLNEKNVFVRENEKLKKDVDYLNSLAEKVVIDFEHSIKAQEDKEHIFQKELKEARIIIQNLNKEVHDLNQANQEKDRTVNKLKEMRKNQEFYEQKYLRIKDEIKELEEELVKSKQANDYLQDRMHEIEEEYEQCLSEVKSISAEKEIIRQQMTVFLNQKEEDYNFYKKHIADLVKMKEDLEESNSKEIANLKVQITELSQKIQKEKTAHENLAEIHEEMSSNYMKSIKELVDLKNSKEELTRESHEVFTKHETLAQDLTMYVTENEMLKNKLEEKIQELQGLQNKHLNVLEKCISLEKQLQETHQQDHNKDQNNESLNEKISFLENELEQSAQTIHNMKMEITHLQQQVILLELEKSEISFKLQETQKLLETEKNLSDQLNDAQKLLLAAVIEMKEAGKVEPLDCLHLLHMARSGALTDGKTKLEIENLFSDGKSGQKQVDLITEN